MLATDLSTVACEVPVYLTGVEIAYFKSPISLSSFRKWHKPITGHIVDVNAPSQQAHSCCLTT